MPTSAPRGKVARESARSKMRGSSSVPLASVWGRANATRTERSVKPAPTKMALRYGARLFIFDAANPPKNAVINRVTNPSGSTNAVGSGVRYAAAVPASKRARPIAAVDKIPYRNDFKTVTGAPALFA